MNYKIVHSDKEFEEFYFYESKPDEYPKKYPCLVEEFDEGGGLGGSYRYYSFTYFPKNVNQKSFMLGYKAGRKNNH